MLLSAISCRSLDELLKKSEEELPGGESGRYERKREEPFVCKGGRFATRKT